MRRAVLLFALVAAPSVAEPPLGRATTPPGQSGQAAVATQSPFVGHWVANLSRSKQHPNHQFKSATLQFAVNGDTVTLTHGGVNASGQEESGTIVIQADGKEHPIPQAPGVVSVARWMGPHVLETVGKKDGQTVGRGTYEVSADGKTLTARVSGRDGSGAEFDQAIVFDRK
jgi:endonuclease YncB( thermonuclease family)